MSTDKKPQEIDSPEFAASLKAKLLSEYAEQPAMLAYFMSAYSEFESDGDQPAPDVDGDLVHNFGLCMTLADLAPLSVHFHVDTPRQDAIRLLRKMADRIEGDPALLNGNASDNESLSVH